MSVRSIMFWSLLSVLVVLNTATVQATASLATDYWVDAVDGDDSADGLTPGTAFRTIGRAAQRAAAGTTIHILPGVYRETVRPAADGTAGAPIVYQAEDGPGTATVRGSEASASLAWNQLTSDPIGLPAGVDPRDIYYADLSGWDLDGPPRFVVELAGDGAVAARLPMAREPDWHVETEWKHHELWWTADGGWDVAGCYPPTDDDSWACDLPWRCENQLTDRNHYPEPDPRIESGDLTTLGNLTGGTLVALDAKQGHYVYRRAIVGHDTTVGRLTLEGTCHQDGGASDPGLGWGSKYYVEDHPALLDSPGEWWYDEQSGRLYLWPRAAGNPANQPIEISRRERGFDLTSRSYITLDGLTIELVNEEAVNQSWGLRSYGNTVRDATLRYANQGVVVQHSVDPAHPDKITRDFTLEDSEIAYMDTHAVFVTDWWDGAPNPANFTHSGVTGTVIRGNEMHHLGFRTEKDNAIGVAIQFPNQVRFEDNHIHDVAHNGVQFLWSVIQSAKTRDFSASEIKTGEILVKDNLFEQTCQLTTDCAGLKFWGTPPDNHVFRDVLVTGNTFRDVFGWTYAGATRAGWWTAGEGCQVQGQGAFGLYLDYASGIHAYRNIAYNNAYAGFMFAGTWRDGDLLFYNNVAANSQYGFRPSGISVENSVNTQFVNNIIANNEGYGIYQCDNDHVFGNLLIDQNLYYNNGWRAYEDGGVWKPGTMAVRNPDHQHYYPTVPEIRTHTAWEDQGLAGDPAFWQYNSADHDPYDGSRPDFHLTPQSDRVADRGASIPASLTTLLNHFGVPDPQWGPAMDIGRYEGSFLLSPAHFSHRVDPGGSAIFALEVESIGGFAEGVSLSIADTFPDLDLSLEPSIVSEDTTVTLTVVDANGSEDARLYTLPILGMAGNFSKTVNVGLVVNGKEQYLPLILRD